MKSTWSKMPSRWVQAGDLVSFRASSAGENAAALKVYMALAMFANFKPSPAAKVAGFASQSFTELEQLCDISRQYVARGVELLVSHELIEVHKIGNRNGYVLTGYNDPGWAKLPREHLLGEARFRGLGIRGALHLNALKLYLALITFRDNNAQHAFLSYDKIQDYTGIPRPRIRRSIDVLINHDWISLASNSDAPSDTRPTNVYILRGDFWGKRGQTYARASMHAAALASPKIDLD